MVAGIAESIAKEWDTNLADEAADPRVASAAA